MITWKSIDTMKFGFREFLKWLSDFSLLGCDIFQLEDDGVEYHKFSCSLCPDYDGVYKKVFLKTSRFLGTNFPDQEVDVTVFEDGTIRVCGSFYTYIEDEKHKFPKTVLVLVIKKPMNGQEIINSLAIF